MSNDLESQSSTALPTCNTAIQDQTSNNRYGDVLLKLVIEGVTLEVSAIRLAQICPLFETMLGLPQNEGATRQIELSDRLDDFAHFLWYVNVDPHMFERFRELPDSSSKCSRYIAIATIAHKYLATSIAQWAMQRAFAMLETSDRKFDFEVEGLTRLLILARLWNDDDEVATNLLKRTRDIWCDVMYIASDAPAADDPSQIADDLLRRKTGNDPVGLYLAAKKLGDKLLQAHALFYILRCGPGYINSSITSLSAIDRQRLLCGDRALSNPFSVTANIPPSPARVVQSAKLAISRSAFSISVPPPPSTVATLLEIAKKWASAWTPRVHNLIKKRRNNLWQLFSVPPWPLD
ncbi:hypothetical protein BKA62DRAFT_715241 [Auriculariales sp. MPI-PUGE-AT-0066]|nr:hypothetical protein BKA62DRAFT_715241 [Auriculariales sp. MPI-PUGE-AT-0066]